MLEVDPLDVSHWISRYLYPFARIAGLLMVMPLVGSRMVSQRVRIFFSGCHHLGGRACFASNA